MLLCTIDACKNKHAARGYCHAHYKRFKKDLPLLSTLVKRPKTPRYCSIEDCNNIHKGLGYCRNHLRKLRRKSLIIAPSTCKICGNYSESNALCEKHRFINTKRRYKHYKHDCTKRGYIFEIEFIKYEELIKMPCHYCSNFYKELGLYLDRKDSNKHYTIDNVVPCCGKCNRLKNNMLTETEMLQVIYLLKKLRNKNDIWKTKE